MRLLAGRGDTKAGLCTVDHDRLASRQIQGAEVAGSTKLRKLWAE
jgi:hypothetical protein